MKHRAFQPSLVALACTCVVGFTLVTQAEDKKEAAPASAKPAYTEPAKLTETAPETFKVKFETTKGSFTVESNRKWAPVGVDRFYNMVKSGFFKDIAMFRAISGFMVQFGVHGEPAVAAAWRDAKIKDDPTGVQSNTPGMLTFAMAGPNTRTTQMFINFGDNARLDSMGFPPVGKVIEGMDIVNKINTEYGEGAPRGRGPNQQAIQMEGNAYLKKDFPNLDYIKSVTIVK